MKNISVGIDIGSSAIKLVQMKKTAERIEVEKFIILDLNLSPEEKNNEELKKIKIINSIKRAAQESGIKLKKSIFAIPPEIVNVRFLSLPIIEETELKEAFKFGSMKEFIPFDLKEMVWDFLVSKLYRRKDEVGPDGKQKMEVILVLAPKNGIEEYLNLLKSCKITPYIIHPTIFASLDFIYHHRQFSEDTIWGSLNIGARNTTISIIEGDSLKFTLNFPWGGENLTEVLSKELSTEISIAESWKRSVDLDDLNKEKITRTFVMCVKCGSTITTERYCPACGVNLVKEYEKTLNIIHDSFNPILKEISRALRLREEALGNRKISELIVSGGSSKFINFSKYLKSVLEREIYPINTLMLKLITKDTSLLLEQLASLDIAIGSALRSFYETKNKINLLPPEFIYARRLEIKEKTAKIIESCVAIFLLGLFVLTFFLWRNLKKTSYNLEKEFKNIELETRELVNLKALTDKFVLLDQEIKKLANRKKISINTFPIISKSLPEGMWLDMIKIRENGEINISGKVSKGEFGKIETFIKSLNSHEFFSGLELKGSNESGDVIIFTLARKGR